MSPEFLYFIIVVLIVNWMLSYWWNDRKFNFFMIPPLAILATIYNFVRWLILNWRKK